MVSLVSLSHLLIVEIFFLGWCNFYLFLRWVCDFKEVEARSKAGYRRVGLATDICALTSEDCQKIRRYWEFISLILPQRCKRGSISVVRKLMSTYGFFPILDRNQIQNFFFVLSKKWSLIKLFGFNNSMVLKFFFLYNSTKYVNIPFIYFLFISWYLKLSWLGGVSGCQGFSRPTSKDR